MDDFEALLGNMSFLRIAGGPGVTDPQVSPGLRGCRLLADTFQQLWSKCWPAVKTALKRGGNSGEKVNTHFCGLTNNHND